MWQRVPAATYARSPGKIQGNAFLVPRVHFPVNTDPLDSPVSKVIPITRPLHFDHLGAKIRQEMGQCVAGDQSR